MADRSAAVAGRFYPAEPEVLRAQVAGFLADAACCGMGAAVKAIIAPHAGYMYSGPIAGSAYAPWARDGEKIKRVVVIGPAHFESFEGLALSSCSSFSTPLGSVPVDMGAVEALVGAGLAFPHGAAHEREHSLEVQLPFLQVILREFSIVPILAGAEAGDKVARALELLWDGPATRIVISSDLSHYLDFESARELDGKTARSIEGLRPGELGSNSACGRLAIRGLLEIANAHGLGVKTLDVRNSGETAGSREQVVGYGAFAFEER